MTDLREDGIEGAMTAREYAEKMECYHDLPLGSAHELLSCLWCAEKVIADAMAEARAEGRREGVELAAQHCELFGSKFMQPLIRQVAFEIRALAKEPSKGRHEQAR